MQNLLLMSRNPVVWLSLGIAAAIATAIAARGAQTQEVGGQRFAVPHQRLFDDRIAWLPVPEPDSFTFRLDPIRPTHEIPPHLVTVEPADRVCSSGQMAQIVRIACGKERTTVAVGPPYRKVFPHPDYAFAWDYYSVAASFAGKRSNWLQVAWCTPISSNPARPKGTAICTSMWGVDGLVLSLGFEENELNQLPEMRKRATEMLLSWKVRQPPLNPASPS